ncbi:putative ribonuclease H-like domain-containing protein [Tanacetum coccineum]
MYLVEQCARKVALIRSPTGIRAGLGEHLALMERPDKNPIGDQGGFGAWFANLLRIEQYFQVQDYALWDVIENGNSFKLVAQTTTNADGTLTSLILGPVTTEEKAQKKNDVKARSMLLMALPNEHLMTFNQYKDAKTLFAAIQTRFGGNEATKKTQKTLLKQMYENFNNKPNLDRRSFDDLYNNFKIVEQEVKGTASLSLSSQNMVFVSSPSSTNEVNTAYGVSTANTQVSPASTQVINASTQVSTANLSDDTVYAFLASQPNGSQLVYEDLEQIHEDDIEEMDLKWQLALLSMRTRRGPRHQDNRNKNQDSSRRTINVEETSSKAMVAIDGAGSQITDKSRKGVGFVSYNALPPPPMGLFSPPKFDLSNSGLEEFQQPKFEGYRPKTSKNVSEDISNEVRESPDAPLVKELVSDDKLEKTTVFPTVAKIEYVRPKQQENQLGNKLINTTKGKVYTARPKAVNTARPNSAVVNTVRANQGHPQKEDKGYVDSGCSRHMTWNMSYLSDFMEFDGGYVTFGGGAKGEKITSKGTLKISKLDFEDVYFVKELQFNLFSVSQMCDKKNSVLFTNTGCFVLFPDFKLVDESQVLLKVLRKNNMYSVDMKNIVPKECLTFLVAKATLDESMLWHRRLGHVNFKTINKLVKENLVRGLPSKHFENDQTCVACLKGKQHKASFVTDDYSRFTWVFFLATKDETSGILKSFITEIENLVDKKVKIIRCDNGTEFKNRVMTDYKLPITFWTEAVNTTCYVQNMVLVVKPHNKTPYELFRGRTHVLSFKRPFGCHVSKFDGKLDEGFFVGYSMNSKAFRVYNIRTRKVKENLHIRFLEDKPIIAGDGPKWLFDIDVLTKSMNYVPVVAGTNSNDSKYGSQFDSSLKNVSNDEPQPSSDEGMKDDEGINKESRIAYQKKSKNSTQGVNTAGPSINIEPDMFSFRDIATATHADFFADEIEVDISNITTTYPVPSTPNTRIHKDHSLDHVISDVQSSVLTRRMTKTTNEQGFTSAVYEGKTHEDLHTCYTQEEGIDYDEVFAPVAKIEAIRLFLAYASFKDFVVYQMDVKSAFLYGKIEEEVYVCQPLGFEDPEFPDKVYKVEKALYGLHQAPRAWYETLSTYLLDNRFQREVPDEFYGLGLQVTQEDDRIFISQDKYVDEILKKFGFSTVKTASTPMETSKPLLKDSEAEDVDFHLYRSMISSLMYLTSSRPDIMFVVCACARFQVTPIVSHLYAVKRIFRYLKGQPKLGLWYPKDSPFDLEAYFDSDFEDLEFPDKLYKVEKALYGLHQAPRAWYETLFTYLLDNRFQRGQIDKTLFIKRVKSDILLVQVYVDDIIFGIDNESTICIVKNPVFHSKSKHIEIKHQFIRDSNEKKLIQMIKIHIDQNVVDLLTKSFDVGRFQYLIASIGMLNLLKPEESDGFEGIIDFLNASSIRYELTVNPTIYTSCIKQFWATAKAKTVNGEVQIQALIDGKKVIVTKTSVRRALQLKDAEGTECLPNATIFVELERMGYENLTQKLTFYKAFFSPQWKFLIHTILQCLSAKTTAWNEFSSTMASAIIYLAINQKFNFSKYIFNNMVKNLEGGVKFLMYPRRKQRKDTEVPQPSGSTEPITDEAANEEHVPIHYSVTSQAAEIAKLKKRVKKLERRNKSRTPGLKRLRKVDRIARIESSKDEGLGAQEDASKQGREIIDLDADAEVTLVDEAQERNDDNLMFDTGVFDEHEVEVEKVVSTAEVTTASATTITVDELTLAQTLIEIKAAKPKVVTTVATTTTTVVTRPKARGVVVQEPIMMEADYELAQRLQAKEQGELTIEERSKLYVELMDRRKKHFAKLRAEEIRRKPPTKAQKRNQMYSFVPMDTEVVEGNENVEAKVDDEAEMKKHMEIVPDNEVTIDAIPLATKSPIIVDWKIIKEGKMGYFKSSKLMKVQGESEVWRNLQGYNVTVVGKSYFLI